MAGHRRGKGRDGKPKPKRSTNRAASYLTAIRDAPTAEETLAVTFDYWRSVIYRLPLSQREDKLHELATWLANDAKRQDRRSA